MRNTRLILSEITKATPVYRLLGTNGAEDQILPQRPTCAPAHDISVGYYHTVGYTVEERDANNALVDMTWHATLVEATEQMQEVTQAYAGANVLFTIEERRPLRTSPLSAVM